MIVCYDMPPLLSPLALRTLPLGENVVREKLRVAGMISLYVPLLGGVVSYLLYLSGLSITIATSDRGRTCRRLRRRQRS